MEQIKIENLSFCYPLEENKAIENLSLSVQSGEFLLLCGKSGCGKTTLLRQIKKELSPHGKKSGSIFFEGKDLDELSLRESAEKIGFVMQNPDSQIVTDKVWHEIAFGLENLGLRKSEIRLRTAEMASYFGIGEWFNKKTTELSGGQKQIMNLAAVMAMHPKLLILDEPTAQLDPIAAEKFLQTVSKINRELGTTVILSEQRLEEAFCCADRVAVIDGGKLVFDAPAKELGEKLKELPAFIRSAVPTAMRLFSQNGGKGTCPISVREGRKWLEQKKPKNNLAPPKSAEDKPVAVELKNVCFRYEKSGKDVLNNLSLRVPQKEIFAILGGNAAGKTTLLKVISGSVLPYDGKIRIYGQPPKKSKTKIAFLPQDVQSVFTAKTVALDLNEMEADREKVAKTAKLTGTENLLHRHPFDLSAGEQQRAALAKILLCEPDILLLDEPTKGMDAAFKTQFARIILELKNNGKTVVMISHDIEFCAKYADSCAMLFDAEIASSAPTRRFFNENHFYTTAANRMARGIIDFAVTEEDINLCLKEDESYPF